MLCTTPMTLSVPLSVINCAYMYICMAGWMDVYMRACTHARTCHQISDFKNYIMVEEATKAMERNADLLEWPKKDKRWLLHVVYRAGDLEHTIEWFRVLCSYDFVSFIDSQDYIADLQSTRGKPVRNCKFVP